MVTKTIDADDIRSVVEVLKSSHLTQGKMLNYLKINLKNLVQNMYQHYQMEQQLFI